MPAKQPWWIWINNSCEFIMNDSITTTKQSTSKPCAYFLRYTVPFVAWRIPCHTCNKLKNCSCFKYHVWIWNANRDKTTSSAWLIWDRYHSCWWINYIHYTGIPADKAIVYNRKKSSRAFHLMTCISTVLVFPAVVAMAIHPMASVLIWKLIAKMTFSRGNCAIKP